MKDKGVIVSVNYLRDLIAFECDGDYGYFEITQGNGFEMDEFEIDDIVYGDLKTLGNTTVTKNKSNKPCHITIEDYGLVLEQVLEAIS